MGTCRIGNAWRLGSWLGAQVLAAVVSLASAEAQEHQHGVDGIPDWYDVSCCNQRDCRPVPDSEIEFSQMNGQIVARHKPTGSVFTRDRFKTSQDERYHVCIYNGQPLCFYDRTGA